jgi:hypothetical protein
MRVSGACCDGIYVDDDSVCAAVFPTGVAPALTLVMGALLAPGKRTVSQLLRVMGLADEPQFQRYHRVLNPTALRCRPLSTRSASGRRHHRPSS